MPVIRPDVGGTPEAMDTPMQSGKATRNTTTEAIASLASQFLIPDCVEEAEFDTYTHSLEEKPRPSIGNYNARPIIKAVLFTSIALFGTIFSNAFIQNSSA